jgi:hypothetical protein
MIFEENVNLTVECIDDLEFNLQGFLGLKSKFEKHPGLTKGKTYQVVRTQTSAVGYMYSSGIYVAYQIVDDQGHLTYHPASRFQVKN